MGKSVILSIIIPAVDNADLTQACIESIRKHSALPHEIVLVDNGSQEGPGLSKLDADIYLHYEELLGYPAAVNRGIEAATGAYICILNNDTEIRTPGWDKTLINTLNTYPNAAIVSPVVDMIGNPFQRAEGPGGGVIESTWDLYFVVVLMRRVLFDKAGFLDEGFGLGSWEDIEFCRRVKSQGGRFFVNQTVFVHHKGHGTFLKIMGHAEFIALMEFNKKRFQGLKQ